jgi:hypothetical protein
METVIGILVGNCSSAACGFRVFVPMLALGIAGRVGHVPLSGDFHWIATTPALIALGTATVVEIVAYYVPWLDHALDTIATPSAILAGVIVTAAVVGNLPPVLRWGLAIVAGGGAAGTVQGATVLARLKSGTMTAGTRQPVVATAELAGSVVTSILADCGAASRGGADRPVAVVDLPHHAQSLLWAEHAQDNHNAEHEILDDRREPR